MTMATNEELEIYKQRYETFRYLDRLRWQMLQIAVIVGSLILAYGKDESEPARWVLAVVGALLTILGSTMLKIRHGINVNNQVLHKAATRVGDTEIPPVSKCWKSIGCWISWALIGIGALCIAKAIISALFNGGANA